MKISSFLAAIGLLMSPQLMAEPYAEWGVLAGGIPLSEVDPSMKVPEVSEVPIPPPPPDAKFIAVSGNKFCNMGLRSSQSVEELCGYYRSELSPLGYAQVVAEGFSSEGCEIYKNGDMETNLGVMVSKHEDPMYVENGSTLIVVNYIPKNGKNCSN